MKSKPIFVTPSGPQDEVLQMLQEEIKVPKINCPSNYPIVSVCTTKGCRSKLALHCSNESCESCGNSQHDLCSKIELKQLTRGINTRMRESRDLMTSLIRKELEVLQ
jgi:hypothetical protein